MLSKRIEPAVLDQWGEVRERWSTAPGYGNGDLKFYEEVVEEYGRPSVELGIGDGRVAAVTRPDVGVDVSTASLHLCRKKLGDFKTELITSEFASYQVKEPAALSYAPLNTFNHILTPEHRIRCFRNIWRNTRPGGRLVFDTYNITRETLAMYNRVVVEQARGEGWAFYLIEEVIDLATRLSAYHGILEEFDERGLSISRRRLPPLPHVCIPDEMLAGELQQSGWTIDHLWGGFDRRSYSAKESQQVWVVVR